MTQPAISVSPNLLGNDRFTNLSYRDFRTPTFRALFRRDRSINHLVNRLVSAMIPAGGGVPPFFTTPGEQIRDAALVDVLGGAYITETGHVVVAGRYHHHTQKMEATAKESHLGNVDRGGVVKGLVTNKNLLRFSVRVADKNVAHAQHGNALRTLTVLEINRSLLSDSPVQKDVARNFLADVKVANFGEMLAKIHFGESRGHLFLTPRYMLLKAAVARLVDLQTYYDACIRDAVKTLPRKSILKAVEPPREKAKGEHETACHTAFEMEFFSPIRGTYPALTESVKDMMATRADIERKIAFLHWHARYIEASAVYEGLIRMDATGHMKLPYEHLLSHVVNQGLVYDPPARKKGVLIRSNHPSTMVWRTGDHKAPLLRFRLTALSG